MYDLKACIACLSIDTKLYNMDSGQLRNEFHLITGLQVGIIYLNIENYMVLKLTNTCGLNVKSISNLYDSIVIFTDLEWQWYARLFMFSMLSIFKELHKVSRQMSTGPLRLTTNT